MMLNSSNTDRCPVNLFEACTDDTTSPCVPVPITDAHMNGGSGSLEVPYDIV